MANILAADVSEWLDLMADTVTVAPWSSQSASGVPTYGAAVSYTARVEMKNHLIVDAQGREVLARGRVFMATTTVPSVKDKVTLPSRYVPVSPPILAVSPASDNLGMHHVTLEIG